MVNRLPRKTITDSTVITHKITIAVTLVIVEIVLDVIKLAKRVRTCFQLSKTHLLVRHLTTVDFQNAEDNCASIFLGVRPSPCFSLFRVVRPTQIFAFSKKKSYEEGNDIYVTGLSA